jgi:3-oxoacyl-[acyl-carrier protein] reductase
VEEALQAFGNKVVMVTGGGRGIGKRLAVGFAAAGASVVLVARSKVELDLTQLEIQHAGGSVLRIRADVRSYSEIQSAVERTLAHFRQLDVLVCSAGVLGPIGPLHEADPEAWASALQTNLVGVFNACRAVLPHMVRRRSGKIIALGGNGTMRARANFSAYAAAKAAVVRLVETLAEEVREYNIQVNCLGPGFTYTHMTDEILAAGEKAGWKDAEEALNTRMTGGVAPQEQMQLALFLASEQSNHISGKLIHISDEWKRLEHSQMHPELYTLRRVRKV